MVQITLLPPQEAVKQLTARYVINTLGEHATAFMNANNINGFLVDDDYVLRDDRIIDLLMMLSCTTGLHAQHLKDFGWKLRRLIKCTGAKISVIAAYDLAARALGYHCYSLAHKCRHHDDFIDNLWKYGAVINDQILDSEDRTVFKKNQRAFEALRHRRVRNRQRDSIRPKAKPGESEAIKLRRRDVRKARMELQRSMPIIYR